MPRDNIMPPKVEKPTLQQWRLEDDGMVIIDGINTKKEAQDLFRVYREAIKNHSAPGAAGVPRVALQNKSVTDVWEKVKLIEYFVPIEEEDAK